MISQDDIIVINPSKRDDIRRQLVYALLILIIGWLFLLATIFGDNLIRKSATMGFFVLSIPTAWVTWQLTFLSVTNIRFSRCLRMVLRFCAIIHIFDWALFYSIAANWIEKLGSIKWLCESVFGTFPIIYFLGAAVGCWFFAGLARSAGTRLARYVFIVYGVISLCCLVALTAYIIFNWNQYLMSSLDMSGSYFTQIPSTWSGWGGLIWSLIFTVVLADLAIALLLIIRKCHPVLD
ncbi:hypothetical protein ACFL02_04345 [Planctomycetota bacterium]